jgi:hypothetical protein
VATYTLPTRAELVRRAISVLANDGPTGPGAMIAAYLLGNVADLGDTTEVRESLERIERALRPFREELRAIDD